ncbi:hypothetical protein WKI68_43105 [Streptomyces sp. MS1.HAVA.3]|uniref:Uncharacterized protein n=1 Tax=Streptomyces caledonius TaxID=3134107 RepID=A0ABU8UE76_9ACTN
MVLRLCLRASPTSPPSTCCSASSNWAVWGGRPRRTAAGALIAEWAGTDVEAAQQLGACIDTTEWRPAPPLLKLSSTTAVKTAAAGGAARLPQRLGLWFAHAYVIGLCGTLAGAYFFQFGLWEHPCPCDCCSGCSSCSALWARPPSSPVPARAR